LQISELILLFSFALACLPSSFSVASVAPYTTGDITDIGYDPLYEDPRGATFSKMKKGRPVSQRSP